MTDSSTFEDWEPLAEGTLAQIASQRKRRRWVQRATHAATGLVAASLVIVLAMLIAEQFGEAYYGNIACSEVARLLPDYRAGRLAEPLEEKIAVHLRHCGRCQKNLLRSTEQNRDARNFSERQRLAKLDYPKLDYAAQDGR